MCRKEVVVWVTLRLFTSASHLSTTFVPNLQVTGKDKTLVKIESVTDHHTEPRPTGGDLLDQNVWTECSTFTHHPPSYFPTIPYLRSEICPSFLKGEMDLVDHLLLPINFIFGTSDVIKFIRLVSSMRD